MKRNLMASVISFALVASASAQAPSMIKRGNVLFWSTTGGNRGIMKIASVDGLYFEVDQTNEANRAAGTVRLYGAIVDNGHRVVLINVGQWKEVWDGAVSRDEINGRLAAGPADFNFKITATNFAPAPSTAPFLPGRTMKWESDAMGGQRGTLRVTSVKGPMFFLEQINVKNPGAGATLLEGEIKDGTVYIYNRKWSETWVGTFGNGAVSGRINNRYTFRIFE